MSSQPIPPITPAAAVARELGDDELAEERDEQTDSDGTPVGEADHREDIRRAGGDPDEAE